MTLQLRLGATVLDFADWADHGVVATTVDLGYPAVREVLTDLPGQDGAYDETAFSSTRLVTITGHIAPGNLGDRSYGLANLMPFMAPGARPQLVYSLVGGGTDRVLTMRAMDWTAPISSPEGLLFTASWKCSDPIAYQDGANEVDLAPTVTDPAGRVYDLTFPRVYPPSLAGAGAYVVTAGDYATFATLGIFGPCTDPAVYWLDPVTSAELGIQVVFAGITVADGDYLEVDTRAQTVNLNGDPAADRYSFLDFSATQFGPLQPGINLLRFTAATAAPPTTCQLNWSDAHLI